MDIAAIPVTLAPVVNKSLSDMKPTEVARQFDALLWQMLISETHLFQSGEAAGSVDGEGQAIGFLLDQILAVQFSQSLDLGIGRAALGRAVGDLE